MINLALSFVAGIAVFFGTYLPNWWQSVAPSLILGLVAIAGAYFGLSRLVFKRVEAIFERSTADLQKKPPRFDGAVETLREGYRWGRWQLFVRSQVDAQIGVILFLQREFKEAFPYLQRSFIRHWVARGMLGVTYMKRKQNDKMKDVFDTAVRLNKKEGLLWSLYAFCLLEIDEREKAMSVLAEGEKAVPGDERIKQNLLLLQNNKKMKMTGYGESWLQFHLAKVPQQITKQPYYHRYR